MATQAAREALAPSWQTLCDAAGPLAPLFEAKRQAARALLAQCRAALDALPGPRRRLEPQAFPPPFDALSGFPLRTLEGVADAVGIKLYTMHWPMIARYWTRDLIGAMDGAAADSVALALAEPFDFVDVPPDPAWRWRARMVRRGSTAMATCRMRSFAP